MAISDDIRCRLAAWCRSRRNRTREFRFDRPCDWRATGVTDPRCGQAFTEDGAWDYIAEQIEGGVEIDIVELAQPPGKKGYAMLLPSNDPRQPFYVKLQISSEHVIGRSFHYTEHG